MPRIIVSLPSNPYEYLRNKYSWSQNCYFIYKAISDVFGDMVQFVPYNQMQTFKYDATDILVTTSGGFPKLDKIIMIAPSNFLTSKWKYGSYNKYGYDIRFIPPTDIYDEHIKRCSVFLAQTNDVAIDKWNNDHEDVAEYKKWHIDNKINIKLLQHPIDKNYYSSFYQDVPRKHTKMLVYSSSIPKDATNLINLLKKMGYIEHIHYDVYTYINTKDMNRLLNEYTIMTHTSFSEGFPYLANEFMTAGMLPFCTDEWWNGYGNDRLLWSYNPELQERNINNLKFLLEESNLCIINKMRIELWKKHLNREDNNWIYFTDILIKEINKLI